MSDPRCPFCDHFVNAGDESCPHCYKELPWVAAEKRIEDQVKQREPSRVRATATLVEEAFNALRTGSPISLSAVKGFVFAMMFPRAVIVLGSVVAGVALIIQTWILGNQTKLLRIQADAAQVDRAERLKDRASKASTLAIRFGVIQASLAPKYVLAESCTSCRQPSLYQSFDDLRASVFEKKDTPVDRLPASTGLSEYLEHVDAIGREIFVDQRGDFGRQAWMRSMVSEARLHCDATASSAAGLILGVDVLLDLKLPQRREHIGALTHRLSHRVESATQLLNGNDTPLLAPSSPSISTAAFIAQVNEMITLLNGAVGLLASDCVKRSEADQVELRTAK